jgi:tRNA 2-thiouridine synthesizing protein A
LFGLSHGIINQAQYSSLVATVVASAVIPTVIANAFYLPRHLLPSSRLENANRTVRRPYRLGRIGPSRIARGGARKSTLEKPMIRVTVQCRVDAVSRLRQGSSMITTKLDLKGLKCPLPALKTRKALKALNPGDRLEVHCTDPLSVIDIPNLIRETGDKVEITGQAEQVFVFLIEKQNGFVGTADE